MYLSIIVVVITLSVLYQVCPYHAISFDVMNMENVQILYRSLGKSMENINKCIITSTIPLLECQQKEMIRKIEFTRQSNSSELQESAIANFSKLERIILSRNNITTIKTGAFSDLPFLKYVYLGDNHISNMEFNIFIDTPRLLELHLEKNKLSNFEQVWLGYIPTLEWLNLEHNSIQTIATGAFSNFPELVYINLGHNQIQEINEDAFYGLDQLEILDLSYNRIKVFHEDTFISPSSLHVLNLYHNQLTYISERILENLTQLRELVTLFNPWQCGCYKLIETWAERRSIRLNKSKYLKCEKTEDISEIPKSVCSQNHDCNKEVIECVTNKTENLCDKLYSETEDFECYFQYEKYIDVK
ncbi:hypothetical protein ILUMI_03906 [Ignelater luminosus]|uniref:Uncharacterized protein n=1 Tax=Ignelater luminosus TaxID=2038154 RepID=A0A8K0D9Y4_IGNLU|nr:hypothetical protein ILUMI_03906 [Ignelater luminosus]